MWIARYGCGCMVNAPTKRALLEYCGLHGSSREEMMKVPMLPASATGKPRSKPLTKKEIDALIDDDDRACDGRIM